MNATSSQDIRRENRRHMLCLLRNGKPLSRAHIARIAGLTEPAVSRIARELIDAGLVAEMAPTEPNNGPGRPLIGLRLGDRAAYVLGIDISAFTQQVCLANIRGEILESRELDLLSIRDPLAALKKAASEAAQLMTQAGIERRRVMGAGVAIAGLVDPIRSRLIESPTLGWRNVAVAGVLEDVLSMPIKVEGRPITALLAENRLGIAREKSNVALVLVSLGIGGALMMDGQLVRGRANAAGQIGHMQMPGAKGLCSCGKHGCLDTVASGHAILTRLGMLRERRKAVSHRARDAKLLRRAAVNAQSGDHDAVAAFRRAGEELGRGLKAVTAVGDPEMIVLAGVVSETRSYVDGVRATFPDDCGVTLSVSRIANDVAAAALALEAFVFSRDLDFERLRVA